MTHHLPQLLVLLDHLEGGHAPVDIARAALDAGARMLLWRAPHLRAGEYMEHAHAIAQLCTAYAALFLTHDRCDAAIATAADGCHLPGYGLSMRDARTVLGKDAILGKSVHGVNELRDSGVVDALSYATLSPIYETPSKPGYGPALTPSIFEAAKDVAPDLPFYALGGLTPGRVAECVNAGAHGVAILGGISHADEPYAATIAYLEALADV